MIRRARILWDLDDTLNPLMRSWLEWAGQQMDKSALPPYSKIRRNPPHQLIGITLEEYLVSLDRFRQSTEAACMPVESNVLEWFNTQGHRFEHHVLTARPHATVHAAAEWVFRNLGEWIRHFHFVPALRPGVALPDAGASKASMIKQLGGFDYFLDDTEQNLSGINEYVGRCFLVPQPWNCQSLTLSQILKKIQ